MNCCRESVTGDPLQWDGARAERSEREEDERASWQSQGKTEYG